MKKDASHRVLTAKMRSRLAKRQKVPIFQRKIPVDLETFLSNQEKAVYQKKLAYKSKKIELNCTNLELKSKNTCSDCAKTSDPSISFGQQEVLSSAYYCRV